MIIYCFIGQCTALISAFVFNRQQNRVRSPKFCPAAAVLGYCCCITRTVYLLAACSRKQAQSLYFLRAIFLLSFFYLLFPGCTSKCIIKMCFTVNSESVSHAGVICQFQSVASEIQSYNTCSDTVCTRTVPVFCVAYLHTRLCHRGSCSSITAVHRRSLHGRGGVWGYSLPHLNASTTVRVSLLTVKQYEI